LIARLREDGLYPQVDIDTPFIELPDQVDGQFCGWESACTVGDRKELLTPSPTRKPLSLLQLALHNLDPQMLPTHWRFKYARYLQPAWKPLLGSRYLIDMVSSLDIGGQYEGLINREFYPPDARSPGCTAVEACFAVGGRCGSLFGDQAGPDGACAEPVQDGHGGAFAPGPAKTAITCICMRCIWPVTRCCMIVTSPASW
jgi:hypothetical protein